MTTILYSGYYDPDKDTNPFEVDPNFFNLTSCDLPNMTLIKHNKKDYVLVEIPESIDFELHVIKKLCRSLSGIVVVTTFTAPGKMLSSTGDAIIPTFLLESFSTRSG